MLPVISPAETLQKLRDGKIRLVDIREPDEVNAVRVPGAEVAPLSVIKWTRLAPASPDLPIVFTCNSGNRTTKQSDLLEELAGVFVWPPMIWLSAFVGAGLVFAGVTGFCGLGLLLSAMPWNKK